VERSPEARRRTLPCPGVADKQVARTVGTDDTDAVQLDGTLLGQAVHDQEFVERIGKWGYATSKLRQEKRVQLEGRILIGAIHKKRFDRGPVDEGVPEVKAEIHPKVRHPPRGARIKQGTTGARGKVW